MNLKGILFGMLVAAVLALLTGLLLIRGGAYNIAATEPHTAAGKWAFTSAFRNSVKRQAQDIEAPALTRAMIDAGAPEYKAMCVHCHGGVGVSRATWAEGMSPRPPQLTRAAGEWSAEEIFWLVKHGAKMTGMPAFGPTHDDATLWNVAAFVKALPGMPESQYAAYSSNHGGPGETNGHSHSAGTPPHAD